MIGHSRGAATRLLAVIRIAETGAFDLSGELVQQLDMVRADVSLALGFARDINRAPHGRVQAGDEPRRPRRGDAGA